MQPYVVVERLSIKQPHMKIIYSLAFLSLIAIPQLIHAQCTPVIPAHAQVIPFGVTDSSVNHPGSVHHVCFNSFYYYYNNNPDTIYLEGSARLTIGFSTNLTVFMQNNCHLIIDTTTSGLYDIKKIVYDPTFTLFVDTSHATIDSLVSCPGMTYNYSNFPGGQSPCFLMDINQEELNHFHIFPSVTQGDINIQTSLTDFEINIHNMVGQNILSTSNKNWVSIGEQPAGIYLITVSQGKKKMFTQKIILNK